MACIGIVTSSFPRWEGDFAGNFVLGMCQALVEQGHTIEVVTPQPAGQTTWDSLPWKGIRVFEAPYVRPRYFQKLFYGDGGPDNLKKMPWLHVFTPFALSSLSSVVRKHYKYWDAVISHFIVPSSLVIPKGNIPHLAIAHSGDIHFLRNLPFKTGHALMRLIAAKSHKVGYVSLAGQNILSELLGGQYFDKLVHTPMGIHLDDFKKKVSDTLLKKELGILSDKFVILFLGRLVLVKGGDVLLEAIKDNPNIIAVFAGDGGQRSVLEKQAAKHGIDAVFLGTVADQKIDLLHMCDCLVLPSRVLKDDRQEGLPTVLLEAAAAKLLIIASDTGGVSDFVVHNKTGLLVVPGDSDSLGKAIEELASFPHIGKKRANNAYKEVQNRDWSHLAKYYEQILSI